jgi:hypothetical protein
MRVRWLRAALRNLNDEASYIAADDKMHRFFQGLLIAALSTGATLGIAQGERFASKPIVGAEVVGCLCPGCGVRRVRAVLPQWRHRAVARAVSEVAVRW